MDVEISKRGRRGPLFYFRWERERRTGPRSSERAREDLEWKRRHFGSLGLAEES